MKINGPSRSVKKKKINAKKLTEQASRFSKIALPGSKLKELGPYPSALGLREKRDQQLRSIYGKTMKITDSSRSVKEKRSMQKIKNKLLGFQKYLFQILN